MADDEWRPDLWVALAGVAGAFVVAAAIQFSTVDDNAWAGIALSMASIVAVSALAALSAHTRVPSPTAVGVAGTVAIAAFAFAMVMSSG